MKSFGFKQTQPEGRQSGSVFWWVSPQYGHACSPSPTSTKLKNKGEQLYCDGTKGTLLLHVSSSNMNWMILHRDIALVCLLLHLLHLKQCKVIGRIFSFQTFYTYNTLINMSRIAKSVWCKRRHQCHRHVTCFMLYWAFAEECVNMHMGMLAICPHDTRKKNTPWLSSLIFLKVSRACGWLLHYAQLIWEKQLLEKSSSNLTQDNNILRFLLSMQELSVVVF